MITIQERGGVPFGSVLRERKASFLNQRPGVQYITDRQPLGLDSARTYQPNLPVFITEEGQPVDFWAAAGMVVEAATAEGRAARVLDIGCGEGVFSRWLKSDFGQAVEAVGISSIDFRNATQRQEDMQQEISYLIYDAQGLSDFNQGPFELIVSVKAIEHMADQLAVLEGVYNILRPNGFAFLDIVDLNWRFSPRTDYERFVAFLKNNYDIQVSYKGIAFQKTMPGQLALPLTYAGLDYRSNNTAVATYRFYDPNRQSVQPTRAFEHYE